MHAAAEVFASAAETFDVLVQRLPTDGWDGPGLGEWDLRSLVGHTSRSLVTVDTYLDRPADHVAVDSPEAYYALARQVVTTQGAGAVTERGEAAGRALGADPARAVHDMVGVVVERVRRSDDLLIETIVGGIWLRDYLPTRSFELAVHSLDIAAATGLQMELPPEVLGEALRLAGRIAAALGDGPDVLRALTGRAVLPAGYSVV
jgi:hypothetical protein